MRLAIPTTLAVLLTMALAAGGVRAQEKAPPPPAPEIPVLKPAGDRGPDGNWPGVKAPEKNDDIPPLTAAGRLAYAVLVSARRFTDDAIYEGGDTPEEVEALRILHREPKARDAFLALCRRGSPAGRLFGLCGLWYWDPAHYKVEAADLLDGWGDFEIRFGVSMP